MGLLTDIACRNAHPGQKLPDGSNLVLRIGKKGASWAAALSAQTESV